MGGDRCFVMQGMIQRATLHKKIQSYNLSQGCFLKYFYNHSGDISVSFDGYDTILSVLGKILLDICISSCFLASHSTNRIHEDRFSDSKMIQNMHITFVASLRPNTLATLELRHNSLRHTRNVCVIYKGPVLLQLSHCQ